jgi:general secretion pathway protein J
VPIVSDVKSVQWRFYHDGWLKSWSDSGHQPDGVELTLTMNNGETWRWVFTTPGDKPEVAAPRQEEKQAPAPGQLTPQPQPEVAPPAESGGQP